MTKKMEMEIVIDEEGKISAEAFGYKGKGCVNDIDEILNNMGKKLKTKKKVDYYDKQKVRTNQHI